MQQHDSHQWANQVFGHADLGDPRRTRRLTQIASGISENAGSSLVKSCDSPASIEAVYRFIRNKNICSEKIAESGFAHTSQLIRQASLVLAIQDTTELSYEHKVAEELGNISNSKTTTSKKRSLHVHSTLAIDAQSEKTLGLANQQYWSRQNKNKESGDALQKRKFEDKETSIWMKCFDAMKCRAHDISNVIDVCDRGADIYEYLNYHHTNGHRFLVRAKGNRNLIEPQGNLLQLCENPQGQCCYTVAVKQRGGRKARQAQLTLHYQPIEIARPRHAEGLGSLPLNVIICIEKDSHAEEPLRWILYTNETISSAEDAQQLVRYYELRWRIEEFHKTWKSDGTNVEKLRLQRLSNLKRIAVIQAFVAVRIQQLQEWAQNQEEAKKISCTCYVERTTWQLLWMKVEQGKQIPEGTPSLHWFYYALAKLGGWYDSKRNGRVGVKAIWQGWNKLAEMVESAEMYKSLQQAQDL
tara:strand:+ start:124 stop:1530 length:1407 start_codon:yes stop_codon:yes gene_type:complete